MGLTIKFKALPRIFALLGGVVVFTPHTFAQHDGANVDSAALIDQYCAKCHNFDDFAGGISLEDFSADTVAENPEVGEKVIKRLRAGMMPPVGEERPEAAVVASLAASLE